MTRCPHCGESHGADNHFCPVTGKPIDLGPRLIGQTLLDHFKVITILGEGPTGIVLEVEDLRTRVRLAAKLIHPQHTRAGNIADLLLRDAKKAGNLGCPNIAQVFEVGRDTGAAPAVVRELMVGECLEEYMDEHGQLPLWEAMAVGKDILNALMSIHEAGILNLDLSPADVFLDVSTGVRVTKLVDFGEGHVKPNITLESGDEPESHKYYAPEQRRKGYKGDVRADLFAAGAVIYHMVTGREPARIPAPANSLRKDLSPKLAAVIHKALAAAPDNRFRTAADFMVALAEASADIPAPAPQAAPTPPQPAPAPPAPRAESIPEPAPAPPATTAPIIEASSVQYDQPTGTDEELAQPSVIVDMPEVDQGGSKKVVIGVIAALVLAGIIGAVIFLTSGETEDTVQEPEPQQKVTIKIDVTPKNAVVSVDGKRLDGDPPTMNVEVSAELHSLRAKAEGFEPLEKDIAFDKAKTVTMVLEEVMETVTPEGEEEKVEEVVEEVEEVVEEVEEVVEEVEEVVEEIEPEPTPVPAAPKKPAAAPKKPAAAPKKPAAAPKKPAAAPNPPAQPKKPAAPKKPSKKKDGVSTANPYG